MCSVFCCATVCSGVGIFADSKEDNGEGGWPGNGDGGWEDGVAGWPGGGVVPNDGGGSRERAFVPRPGSDTPVLAPELPLLLEPAPLPDVISMTSLCALRSLSKASR